MERHGQTRGEELDKNEAEGEEGAWEGRLCEEVGEKRVGVQKLPSDVAATADEEGFGCREDTRGERQHLPRIRRAVERGTGDELDGNSMSRAEKRLGRDRRRRGRRGRGRSMRMRGMHWGGASVSRA